MEEKATRIGELKGPVQHLLTIANREEVTISGVVSVESFDDQEIVLETELGALAVRGEELHIKQLDLETGRFAVDGIVHACTYLAGRSRGGKSGKGRGFFERLLR